MLRIELPTAVLGYLLQGNSVAVTGLAGSGRSHMLRIVSEELANRGINVLTIHGNSSFADRPLSALSLAGIEIDATTTLGGVTSLAAATTALENLIGRRSSVIIIDDADELDWGTAGVLVELRRRRDVPLLMTGDKGVVRPLVWQELITAARPAVTIPLSEMLFAEVSQMISKLLDGTADATAVSAIAATSGGLPGVIVSLVQVGRQNGRLTKNDGIWQVNGNLYSPGISPALQALLRGLDDSCVVALTKISQDDDLTFPAAIEELGRDKVTELIHSGLLRIDAVSGTQALRVFPPALGDYLRASMFVPMEESLLHSLLVTHPTGLTGVEAANLANRIMSHWGERVSQAWAVWDVDRRPVTAIPLLVSLFSGGSSFEVVQTVLSQTEISGDDTEITQFVVLKATYTAIVLSQLDEAIAMIKGRMDIDIEWNARLWAHIIHLSIICRGLPDAELLAHLDEDDSGDDMVAVTKAEVLITQGKVNQAREILADIEPKSVRVAALKQTFDGLAMVLGDDVIGGTDWAINHLEEAVEQLNPRLISSNAYVTTLGLAMQGRFDEIESVVEIVYRLAEPSVVENYYKSGLFFMGSFIATWEGRGEYARTLAMQAKSLGSVMGPFPAMYGDLEELSRKEVETGKVWEVVCDLIKRGFVTPAIFLALDAVEISDNPKAVAALNALAKDIDGRAIKTLMKYINQVASGKIEGFAELIDELRQNCGPLDTTRARITWALRLRAAGDMSGWLEEAMAAWREAGAINRPCVGLFDRLSQAVDLSARESEMANYAALGQSSPSIAAKMGVSARTVEAHLQSVYRKTGVSNREDLRRLLRSWLSL
jgi:DNA-binding CsgD family transcriptional regulator/type II secretory pathway predicted ATPase ExeA